MTTTTTVLFLIGFTTGFAMLGTGIYLFCRGMRAEREEIQQRIEELVAKAESGEDWAEICRLESLIA